MRVRRSGCRRRTGRRRAARPPRSCSNAGTRFGIDCDCRGKDVGPGGRLLRDADRHRHQPEIIARGAALSCPTTMTAIVPSSGPRHCRRSRARPIAFPAADRRLGRHPSAVAPGYRAAVVSDRRERREDLSQLRRSARGWSSALEPRVVPATPRTSTGMAMASPASCTGASNPHSFRAAPMQDNLACRAFAAAVFIDE